jgi:hypothetical protein
MSKVILPWESTNEAGFHSYWYDLPWVFYFSPISPSIRLIISSINFLSKVRDSLQ